MRSVEANGYRIIEGRGEAAMEQGAGFTIKRAGTGQYDITFDRPFRSPPNVTANPVHTSELFCHIGTVTNYGCTIYVGVHDGTRANASIYFRARGLV